jgi:hypothetical protein
MNTSTFPLTNNLFCVPSSLIMLAIRSVVQWCIVSELFGFSYVDLRPIIQYSIARISFMRVTVYVGISWFASAPLMVSQFDWKHTVYEWRRIKCEKL